jgi:hypothetical protein
MIPPGETYREGERERYRWGERGCHWASRRYGRGEAAPGTPAPPVPAPCVPLFLQANLLSDTSQANEVLSHDLHLANELCSEAAQYGSSDFPPFTPSLNPPSTGQSALSYLPS